MFVTRENGKIVGAWLARQEFATEELADDNAELLAFFNPIPSPYRPLYPVDFKLGMLTLNVTPDMVDAAINQLEEPDRTRASIYWTSANMFYRDDVWLAMIAASFGKSDEDINGAWEYAMSLSPTAVANA